MTTSFGVFQQQNIGLLYMMMFGSLVISIAIMCFRSVSRKVPVNYIMLFLFTFCEAYMVSTICTIYDPSLVIMAAFMTFAMTSALTLYACTTKTDITYYGGTLFILSCGLFLLCVFGWFTQNNIYHILISVLAVVLYGFYLIYDT